MKEANKISKLQLQAGKANPAPPVGTVLGPTGINMQEFCNQFNDQTKDKMGNIIPVVLSIYDDRSFDFILKEPPMAELIKKIAGVKKGSSEPHSNKVANLTDEQLKEIAELKMPDLNVNSIEAAIQVVAGTARSMGITSSIKSDVQKATAKEVEVEEKPVEAKETNE